MFPRTSERVPDHTPPSSNDRIRAETEARIAYLAGRPHAIDERLEELEREWDVERTLEVNGSVLAMTGLALGAAVDRKWFLLPAAVVGFCLQHALQGWCPPLPLFRRLGVRTQREIDEERYALKALRGDFDDMPTRPVARDEEDGSMILERIRR